MNTSSTLIPLTFADGSILAAKHAVLTDIPEGVTIQQDPLGAGLFVNCLAEKPSAILQFDLGKLNAKRFVCCHRYDV